jgi:hypothetical protein
MKASVIRRVEGGGEKAQEMDLDFES